jgi:hypothetical protein
VSVKTYSTRGFTPTVVKIRRVIELKKVSASSQSGRSAMSAEWNHLICSHVSTSVAASPNRRRTRASAPSTCAR